MGDFVAKKYDNTSHMVWWNGHGMICRTDCLGNAMSIADALNAQAAPPAAVPAGYALVPVAELAAALDAVDGVMQDAYNRGHLVCCGLGHGECCGNSIVEWEPADDAIMSGLQPVHATLLSMLAAANKENTNG